jgi:hypothetical protein
MDPSRDAYTHNIVALIEQLQQRADEQREGLAQLKSTVLARSSQRRWTPQQTALDEQSQAPLDGLSSVLQRVYDCTALLINLVMRVPPEPSGEHPSQVERWWSGTSIDNHSPADHQSLRHKHIRVVDLKICWIPATREEHNEQRGCIIVQRVISHGLSTAPHAPGKGHSSEHDLQEAFDDYVAKKLVDPSWKRSTQVWVTPVCENMASAAEKLSGFHDEYHNLVLGGPVHSIGGLLSPDPASVDVVAGIAEELPLPGDPIFKGAKRLLQYAGILIGAASGHPLLVNACVKSLLKDYLVDTVRDVIGSFVNAIGDTLNHAGKREPAPMAPEPTDPEVHLPTPRPAGHHPDELAIDKLSPFAQRLYGNPKRQPIRHSPLLPKSPQGDRQTPRSPQDHLQPDERDPGGPAILSRGPDDTPERETFFTSGWDHLTDPPTGCCGLGLPGLLRCSVAG